jgi:hypothetical protein
MNSFQKEFESYKQKNVKIDFQTSNGKQAYWLVGVSDCVPLDDDVFEKSQDEDSWYNFQFEKLKNNQGLNFFTRQDYISHFEYEAIKTFVKQHYSNLDLKDKLNYKYHFYDWFCCSKLNSLKYQELPVIPDKIYTYNHIGNKEFVATKEKMLDFLSLLVFLTKNSVVLDSSPLLPSSCDLCSSFYYIFCLLSHEDFWFLTVKECKILLQQFLAYSSSFQELVNDLEQTNLLNIYYEFISKLRLVSKKETNSFLIGFWK